MNFRTSNSIEESNPEGSSSLLNEAFIFANNSDIERGAEDEKNKAEQNSVRSPEVLLDVNQNYSAAVNFDNSDLLDLHLRIQKKSLKIWRMHKWCLLSLKTKLQKFQR